MDKLIRRAMIDAGIKTTAELARVSGVAYQTANAAVNGKNVSLGAIVKLFDAMGFELKYVSK